MIKKTLPWYQLQCVGLAFAAFALMSYPQDTAFAVTQGLVLCGQVILPALFPFFILSSLVIDLGLSQSLGRLVGGVMSPLFRLNGNCATALVLGFVGGYPVGAKTALSLYQSGQCSQTEAKRMLAFCNNSGPAFIIGVIGTGMFASGQIALLFYASHILACLTVGILFRYYKPQDLPSLAPQQTQQTKAFVPAFLSAVSGAVQSTLSICGFILCFSVFISILRSTGLLSLLAECLGLMPGISPDMGAILWIGFLELSSGITSVPAHVPLSIQVPLMAFFLGWGGLSVHCQVLALGEESGLSMKTYFVGNFAQGLLAALYSLFFLQHWDSDLPLQEEIQQVMASADSAHHLFVSASLAWILFLLFAFSWLPPKKG